MVPINVDGRRRTIAVWMSIRVDGSSVVCVSETTRRNVGVVLVPSVGMALLEPVSAQTVAEIPVRLRQTCRRRCRLLVYTSVGGGDGL